MVCGTRATAAMKTAGRKSVPRQSRTASKSSSRNSRGRNSDPAGDQAGLSDWQLRQMAQAATPHPDEAGPSDWQTRHMQHTRRPTRPVAARPQNQTATERNFAERQRYNRRRVEYAQRLLVQLNSELQARAHDPRNLFTYEITLPNGQVRLMRHSDMEAMQHDTEASLAGPRGDLMMGSQGFLMTRGPDRVTTRRRRRQVARKGRGG